MSMSDPIADMLIRIRNAQLVGHVGVDARLEAQGLDRPGIEGRGLHRGLRAARRRREEELRIGLKYYAGRPVIERLERVSKPGLRVYRGRDDIPRVMNGLGVAILSTSRGVMTDRKARADGVGGEVLCIVA